jgi:3-oxoacyl-[acyl-carrier-protein] synthase II
MKTGNPRRVAITGIGAITPLGLGVSAMWDGILAGRSPIKLIDRFDTEGFRTKVAGQVDGFDPSAYISPKSLNRMDRFSMFAVAASKMAVADAGLDLAVNQGAGVIMGSALGGLGFAEEQHAVFMERGLDKVSPSLAYLVFGASASAHIAIELGLTGPNITNSNSCSSGTIAVGEAFEAIRTGRADAILAGGSETPLYPLTFGSFTRIKAMTSRNDDPAGACRPFDKARDGFVMGEAACVLVMEELVRAKERGARIYAEVLGYGNTNDAYHMTSSRPGGEYAAEAINIAMRQAGLEPCQIGYINAHGSSTQMNDRHETEKLALGGAAYDIPMSATKPFHAHPLGATGAIETAVCALAMTHGYLPPTLNLTDPDPECDLDCIPNTGRKAQVEYCLNNSFGFGGMNAVLALGRYGG